MRISAIAPVGRNIYSPVDAVQWHESIRHVSQVEARDAAARGAFQKVMQRMEERPQERCNKVLEVVYAPGLRAGIRSHHQWQRELAFRQR